MDHLYPLSWKISILMDFNLLTDDSGHIHRAGGHHKFMSMKMMRIVCYDLHNQQIPTQLKRLWEILDLNTIIKTTNEEIAFGRMVFLSSSTI